MASSEGSSGAWKRIVPGRPCAPLGAAGASVPAVAVEPSISAFVGGTGLNLSPRRPIGLAMTRPSPSASGAAAPLATIVLVLQDGWQATAATLVAVASSAPAAPYEVVLVDDGTTDETAEQVAHLCGDVTVLRSDTPLGFARAANAAA